MTPVLVNGCMHETCLTAHKQLAKMHSCWANVDLRISWHTTAFGSGCDQHTVAAMHEIMQRHKSAKLRLCCTVLRCAALCCAVLRFAALSRPFLVFHATGVMQQRQTQTWKTPWPMDCCTHTLTSLPSSARAYAISRTISSKVPIRYTSISGFSSGIVHLNMQQTKCMYMTRRNSIAEAVFVLHKVVTRLSPTRCAISCSQGTALTFVFC